MAFKVEGEARVAFTNEPGVVPQAPDNGELKLQQADALLVTRKADGTARLTDLRPMEEQLAGGPLAGALALLLPNRITTLPDDPDAEDVPRNCIRILKNAATGRISIWANDNGHLVDLLALPNTV